MKIPTKVTPQNDAQDDNTLFGAGIFKNRWYLIAVACFVVVAWLLVNAVTLEEGVDNLERQNEAMDLLVRGLYAGDGPTMAEGGSQFLATVLVDAKHLLFAFLIIVSMLGVSFILFRLTRLKRRNRFDAEDKDDDFWNT